MSTEDVVKSVARKLKYYFEVKRLEDGFDLSDLHQLTLKHSPPKTQLPHKHDGLHDKALKQYFSEPDGRSMLAQINSYDARGALQGWREIEVRKMLDNYMKHYTFQVECLTAVPTRLLPRVEVYKQQTWNGQILAALKRSNNNSLCDVTLSAYESACVKKALPSSYYYHSHRKKSHSPGAMLHRRKQKQNNLVRSWPVKRASSDQHIKHGEAERLVNSATKIICGSELSSLGKISCTRKPGGKQSASALSQGLSFPDKTYTGKHSGKMSASTPSQNELSRPTTARSGSTLQYRDQEEREGNKSRSARTQKRQMHKKPHSRSTSPAQSSRSSSTSSRTSSSYSHSSSSSMSSSHSFYRSHSTSRTPKHSPRKHQSPAVINMPGQRQQAEVGVERSTQTEGDASVNNKTSETKTTNSDNQLQEDGRDVTPCEYQVLVRTGDRLGSSTAAPVKLTLFGDKGKTEEFDLGKMSKRHKIPFQKGNEDLFVLPGCHVGRLSKIQIGHDRAQINYAWFLENVSVYDMRAKQVYQFPCGQWLSGQDGDKKTYRILQADSEREFTEAPDASMTKSIHKLRNNSRPDTSSDAAHKNKVCDDTSAHSKPQGDGQNSSIVISSNVRVESDPAKFRDSGAIQRGKKDDYEQKATKIILRSGSKIVDEIILENGNDMDTNGNDAMESDKSLTSEPDQKKQSSKAVERKQSSKAVERKPQQEISIHAAVRDADLDRVKDLLQRSPGLKDQRDENGWTPLHLAASSGNMDILRWLVTSGADVDARTPTELSAMHVAAQSGHVNIMVVLQTWGASILSCTKERQSALHLAAKSGHLDCVKWLVGNGAVLDAEDTSGQTPFRLAETHHHDSCADFLRVCRQELDNPKSTFAQIHARQVSGSHLHGIKERTVSASSTSQDDDDSDSKHDGKGESMSDSDHESSSGKRSDKKDKKSIDTSTD